MTHKRITLRSLLAKFPSLYQKLIREQFTKLPWTNFNRLKQWKFKGKFNDIAVVGIGGSCLGARALCGLMPGLRHVEFLDNVEPSFVAKFLQRKTKTRYILSSKSGETTEVLALTKILIAKKIPSSHFIVITDDKTSSLGQIARKHKIPILIGDKNIPGRFSVFSENSLLPLLLSEPQMGYRDIKKLLKGAQQTNFMRAFRLAAEQYIHFTAGKNITVIFLYGEQLDSIGDWYIQLISESIGKSRSVGITPLKATGVRDQHSQLQLFLDGPRDKFFLFIKNDASRENKAVPGERYSLAELFNAEYAGVKGAMAKKKIPFREIRLPSLTPHNIGHLLFLLELQTAFLGLLFGINYKNQPAVELSKTITKLELAKLP